MPDGENADGADDTNDARGASAAKAARESAETATLLRHPRIHAGASDFDGPAAQRIVSLVPSLSEALFVLGLGGRLVGVTEYCVHPRAAFLTLPKVGGTKDADVDAIVGLAPDLVIANREENTSRVVRRLAESGIDVWVTYPRTVREGAALLRELAGLGAQELAVQQFVVPAERAIENAIRENREALTRPRVFCPIWRDPWMTIARETYIHDMIELCGGENVFADAHRVGTAQSVANRRYPIVGLDEIARSAPDVILLPDEPYAFAEADRRQLGALDCPASHGARIHLIDGTLVSWYGPRIAEAIRALATIFASA